MKNKKLSVTIVGGGPVGLFLGICLSKLDISCTILEKRTAPVTDSRSLGIHPISIDLFDKLGISNPFLKRGLKISKGLALDGVVKLGEIDFSILEKPYNFILACPQFETEKILEKEFAILNSDGLIRGAEVGYIEQNEESAVCKYYKDGNDSVLESDFIIGCDGKNSLIRQEAGIFYGGKRYPDTYIMGDFEDNTDFGDAAAVFLPKQGMIECFPLPNKMRRWVVKTDEFIKKPSQNILSNLVKSRIGHNLSEVESTMLSSFGVQHFMAEKFFKGRIILCGDSAHVVSPIGGQGMNLGWIGAYNLAHSLKQIETDPAIYVSRLNKYQKEQLRVVKKAAKRAELNMVLGRKTLFQALKKSLLKIMLKKPLHNKLAQLFTMHGLKRWWI